MKLSFTLAVLALSLGASLCAHADEAEKQACVTSYTEGQRARKAGHLIKARAHFVQCAQRTCPGMIADDCGGWLSDLDDSLPSVVFRVRDENGVDRADAAIFVDGVALDAEAAVLAVPMDPGPHHLRFERGGASVELDVVVREGEKRRPIEVALVAPTAAPTPAPLSETTSPPPATSAAPSTAPPPGSANSTRPSTSPSASPDKTSSETPVLAYAVLGLGAVAAGTSAVLGVGAKADLDDLRNTCAPHCAQGDVDAVHDRMLVADLTLGVGVVALLVGGYLWLSEPSSNEKASISSHLGAGSFGFALDLP